MKWDTGHQFYFASWPSRKIVDYYTRETDINVLVRKALAHFDLEWNVPASFFQSLFSDAFWREQKLRQDVNGLHAPTIASWPFAYNTDNLYLPMPFEDIENFWGPRRARQFC